MTTKTQRAYRDSATDSGTHIDVLLVCYDALAEEIQSAGTAAASGEIAARCRHSHRAMLLLGHLESWVTLLDDDALQQSLLGFYQYLRTELLQLQTTTEPSRYKDLAMRICETRAAWQGKQATASSRFTPESGETHFSCSI